MTDPAQDPTATTRRWRYTRPHQHVVSAACAAGAFGIYAGALSLMFNPAALGMALGVGAVRAGMSLYNETGLRGEKLLRTDPNLWPADGGIQDLTDEIAARAGLPKQRAYFVIRSGSPAMSVPHMNLILIDRSYLSTLGSRKLEYIIAHELAHTKCRDQYGLWMLGRFALSKTTGIMALMTGASVLSLLVSGNSLALDTGLAQTGSNFLSATLCAGAAGGLLFAAHKGMKLATNIASRMIERRADRNAMYLTRAFEAAHDFLTHAHEKGYTAAPGRIDLSEHPSYYRRIKSLKRSFNEAAAFPLPQGKAPASHGPAADSPRP